MLNHKHSKSVFLAARECCFQVLACLRMREEIVIGTGNLIPEEKRVEALQEIYMPYFIAVQK